MFAAGFGEEGGLRGHHHGVGGELIGLVEHVEDYIGMIHNQTITAAFGFPASIKWKTHRSGLHRPNPHA